MHGKDQNVKCQEKMLILSNSNNVSGKQTFTKISMLL